MSITIYETWSDRRANGYYRAGTSSPVPDIGRIDKREAVSRNHADCITRIEGLGLQLARQFQKLEELPGADGGGGDQDGADPCSAR